MQFLVEEAYATALELHEAGLIAEQHERDEQAAAIAKSRERLERARGLHGGGR